MPIIINEFEIVPEPPQDQSKRPSAARPASEEPVIPDVSDILRLERIYQERKRRLWAD